jgi:hypothetical protein
LLPLGATVAIVRRGKRLGIEGASLWINFATAALIILFALVAHQIEIALWAVVFVICGEFHEFGTAYLSLRRQLHNPRLRWPDHVIDMEITGTAGSSKRHT